MTDDKQAPTLPPDNGDTPHGSLDVPVVDSKNRKDEILSAYKQLMEKYQQAAEGSSERKKQAERKKEDEVVEKATGYTLDAIERSSSELETHVRQWLSGIQQTLAIEVEKLKTLREATDIENKRLEEIHAISAEADTLSQLLASHAEKKLQMEEEQGRTRENWKREQEEYEYELKVKRKRDEAAYEDERVQKVRELEEREQKLKEHGEELIALRQFKEQYEQELADAVTTAKKKTERRIRREEEVKATILAEQTKAEKRILTHQLESLQGRVGEQSDTITGLKMELEEANVGVKDVALKVIEGRAREHEAQQRSLRKDEKEKSRHGDGESISF